MLATDNHIGYLERDPIRGQDSINTFKEILQLAVKNDVSTCISTQRIFLYVQTYNTYANNPLDQRVGAYTILSIIDGCVLTTHFRWISCC